VFDARLIQRVVQELIDRLVSESRYLPHTWNTPKDPKI
jgi:hypothetical protein